MITGRLFLFISGLLLAGQVTAQLSVDGEFRSRSMLDHGYIVPVKAETNAVLSFDQRSRLSLNYKNERYSARMSLQDARVWGSDDLLNKTGVMGNSTSFGIYEAWVELRLKEKSSLRIGRQEWNYNNMRLLSFRNWWTSALSYDGLLYKMHDPENGWFIDMGLSYNNDGNPIGLVDNSSWTGEKIKTLNFLNFKKNLHDKYTISAVFMLSGKDLPAEDKLLLTGTHGVAFNYNTGPAPEAGLFGFLSGYYQHGTDSKTGAGDDYRGISAYLLTGELGYRAPAKKWEVAAGAEVISGHDYKNTSPEYRDTRHSFDLHYGARFPYYGGYMNHFILQDSYKIGTKGGGYIDPYIRMNFKPGEKSTLELTWYSPLLSTHVPAHNSIDQDTGLPGETETDDQGNTVFWKGSLGNYIDLGYTRRIHSDVVVKTGFSLGEVSEIKNQMIYGYRDGTDAELYEMGINYFGWVMLIVTPEFL